MKRGAESGVVCMLKPAILIMTGEETKSVAKLAQKNQEKEKKVFFTSTE